jgi:hypothetical protein
MRMTEEEIRKQLIGTFAKHLIKQRSYITITSDFTKLPYWKKFNDGWFTYYYNTETGERKFRLDENDVLIEDEYDSY